MSLATELRNMAVVFGLVFLSLVLSLLMSIVFGGWRFGRLRRQVEFALVRALLAGFLQRLHGRLEELGFTPGNTAGQFFQGGSQFGDMSSFTHARARKQLDIVVNDSARQEPKVQLSLEYLEAILGDTGESAYGDAVLDSVSGQTDAMKPVPNRSFAAFSAMVGGICAWAALLILKSIRFEPLLEPIFVLGVTCVLVGIMALAAINKQPGHLRGKSFAIAGMIAAASALAFAVFLTVARHIHI